jgi:hypothetical protein
MQEQALKLKVEFQIKLLNMKDIKIWFTTLLVVLLFNGDIFAQLQSGLHYRIKEKGDYWIFYTKDSAKTKDTVHIVTAWRKSQKVNAGLVPSSIKGKENLLVINFWSNEDPDFDLEDPSLIDSKFELNSSSFFFIELEKRKTLGSPNLYQSIPYRTWEVGVTTIPFKIRNGGTIKVTENANGELLPDPQNKVISDQILAGVNAGIYFGRKWGNTRFYSDPKENHNSWSITTAAFLGPTVIEINNENSTVAEVTKSSNLGWSFGGAGILSYRGINLGAYLGWDFLGDPSLGKTWYFNGKPWIGFGIGYKIKMLGE